MHILPHPQLGLAGGTAMKYVLLIQHGLVPGGLYFVEDEGTGYMHGFYDGGPFEGHEDAGKNFTSHQLGMVGWLKQLVDVMHAPVLSPNRPPGDPIASVQFFPHIALVRKIG